jgi:hypothetical protein
MSGKVLLPPMASAAYKECYNGIFMGAAAIAVITTVALFAIFGANAMVTRGPFLFSKSFGGLIGLEASCALVMMFAHYHFSRLEKLEERLQVKQRPASAPATMTAASPMFESVTPPQVSPTARLNPPPNGTAGGSPASRGTNAGAQHKPLPLSTHAPAPDSDRIPALAGAPRTEAVAIGPSNAAEAHSGGELSGTAAAAVSPIVDDAEAGSPHGKANGGLNASMIAMSDSVDFLTLPPAVGAEATAASSATAAVSTLPTAVSDVPQPPPPAAAPQTASGVGKENEKTPETAAAAAVTPKVAIPPPNLEEVVLKPLLNALEGLLIEWNRAAYYSCYPAYRPNRGAKDRGAKDYEVVQRQTAALKAVFAKLNKWGIDFLENPIYSSTVLTILLSMFVAKLDLKKTLEALNDIRASKQLTEHAKSFLAQLKNFAAKFKDVTQSATPLVRPTGKADQLEDILLNLLCPRYASSLFTLSSTAIGAVPADKFYNQKEFVMQFFEGTIYPFHYAFTNDLPQFRAAFRGAALAFCDRLIKALSALESAENLEFQQVMACFIQECTTFQTSIAKIE